MKRLIAVALLGVAFSTCACSTTGTSNTELLKQIDTNFQGCKRHLSFSGGVGVVTPGAQISGSVDCDPQGGTAPAPAVPTTPVGPAA